MGSRVCVIGLDGADLDLLLPWIEGGKLPALKRLMDEATYGKLESTIPPLSPCAWASFMTGVNPAKHGIFDAVSYRDHSYERVFNTTENIRSQKLWDLIGEKGKRSIVINVPLTYPAQRIEGIMISGMMTPRNQPYSNPPEIAEEIEKNVGPYRIDIDPGTVDDEEALIREIHSTTRTRIDVSHYLMKKYPWDLLIMVVTGTDRIQHFFWNKQEEVILPYYRELDSLLGSFLGSLGEETSVIILSDHGFGAIHKTLYLNAWLERVGLLKMSRDLHSWRDTEWSTQLGARFGRPPQPKRGGVLRDLWKMVLGRSLHIDWLRTRAFLAFSGSSHGIHLNLRGRNPQGTIDPGEPYERVRDFILDALLRLQDEEDGRLIMERVFKKEEIYHGPFLGEAPDILFMPRGYQYHLSGRITRNLLRKRKLGKGSHTLYGLYGIRGGGILRGRRYDGPSIMDLFPTILYILDLPVPREVDGKVLREAFESDFLSVKPTQFEDRSLRKTGPSVDTSGEEDEEIERRLRSLGYID